jgi:hypothetical protein
MEEAGCFKTLVTTCMIIMCGNPENQNVNLMSYFGLGINLKKKDCISSRTPFNNAVPTLALLAYESLKSTSMNICFEQPDNTVHCSIIFADHTAGT